MDKYIEIAGRKIGENYPVFIIAEMSANHLQDYDRAVETIKKSKMGWSRCYKTSNIYTRYYNHRL